MQADRTEQTPGEATEPNTPDPGEAAPIVSGEGDEAGYVRIYPDRTPKGAVVVGEGDEAGYLRIYPDRLPGVTVTPDGCLRIPASTTSEGEK